MEYSTYNNEDNSELRKLQLVILDIIKLYTEICEKHNLRYFMVGGTMLGAIRHKGFIPWDDDVDMGMPRADYEKFIHIAQNELPEGYAFLNYKQNPEYKRYFSRLVDLNVKIYNNSNSKEIVENAWLDIFPYDGMPKNKVMKGLHFGYLTGWRFLYHASCFDELVNLNRPGRSSYQQAIIKILSVTKFGSNLNTFKILKKIEKGLCKYAYDDTKDVVSFFGAYMTKEIIEKDIIGELQYYAFEDSTFLGAQHYDEFLKHYYDDYLIPPSDVDKDKHNIRKIEYYPGKE